MGFFKDMKDLKKLGDHHGGMPSMKSAMSDIRAVADDRGEGEVLERGVPAKAIAKGFAMPVPDDRFAMQIPLEVHPPGGGAPYAVNYVFPTARMKAAISVGMELPVKVLPDDPQRIAMQWDAQQAAIAAAGGDMAAVTAGLQETYGGVADAAFRAQTGGAPAVPGAPAAQPAAAGGDGDVAERLNQLGKLREQSLIDDTEYEAKKAEILKDL
ncbi:MAG: hypothetical protein QOE65_559 [Solirubrobacteraceae bacterium]|jgi:hypothetical protein|nr:hypothetical protein [Solirubrobacteraceae bacterium]